MSSKHYIYYLIASGLFHLGETLGDENRTSTLTSVDNGEAGSTDYRLLPLYIIGVVYTFLGLAIVCDEFFVPSLEIMSDKWQLAPNVAGATLMAAGGSAPELFTSFIGTFQGSSVGFSTIVGSAVFNVLFVIGACVLSQRETLHLTPWPLIRDCSYYTISLVVLSLFFSIISPNVIEVWEAAILFALYLFYVYLMKNNDRLQQYFMGNTSYPNTTTTLEPVTFRAGLVRLMLEPANFMEGVSILVVTKISGDIQETFQTIDKDENGYLDRNEVATLLTSLGYQRDTAQLDEFFRLLDKNGDGQISLEEFSEWYLGSETRLEDDANRIYQEVAALSEGDNINKTDINLLLLRLGNESSKHSKSSEEAKESNEEAKVAKEAKDIGVDLESVELTYPQFLEWYKKSLLWKEKKGLQERQLEEAEGIDLSFPSTPFERMKWLATIPMLLAFYLTIPDVRKPQLAKWKYLTFLISIVWIGFISYWMVHWAENIGHKLGIPINVMGLTILAAGTSVPDLLSSMIVARQGEGDMAISSSIGSNIFDILVGLPLPWLAYSIYHDSEVAVEAGNLTISLPILIAMLVIVMGSIHLCEWQTKRPLAYLMFLSYIVFVAQDLARSDW